MVWRTFDEDETVATLVNWHDQWQRPWSDHLDKRVIYAPAPIAPRQGRGIFQSEATPVQKWLYQLPGMGDKKTFDLADRFRLPEDIVYCQDWQTLPGIGKKGGENIWRWIHG